MHFIGLVLLALSLVNLWVLCGGDAIANLQRKKIEKNKVVF
jgi:hypothetical protein